MSIFFIVCDIYSRIIKGARIQIPYIEYDWMKTQRLRKKKKNAISARSMGNAYLEKEPTDKLHDKPSENALVHPAHLCVGGAY